MYFLGGFIILLYVLHFCYCISNTTCTSNPNYYSVVDTFTPTNNYDCTDCAFGNPGAFRGNTLVIGNGRLDTDIESLIFSSFSREPGTDNWRPEEDYNNEHLTYSTALELNYRSLMIIEYEVGYGTILEEYPTDFRGAFYNDVHIEHPDCVAGTYGLTPLPYHQNKGLAVSDTVMICKCIRSGTIEDIIWAVWVSPDATSWTPIDYIDVPNSEGSNLSSYFSSGFVRNDGELIVIGQPLSGTVDIYRVKDDLTGVELLSSTNINGAPRLGTAITCRPNWHDMKYPADRDVCVFCDGVTTSTGTCYIFTDVLNTPLLQTSISGGKPGTSKGFGRNGITFVETKNISRLVVANRGPPPQVNYFQGSSIATLYMYDFTPGSTFTLVSTVNIVDTSPLGSEFVGVSLKGTQFGTSAYLYISVTTSDYTNIYQKGILACVDNYRSGCGSCGCDSDFEDTHDICYDNRCVNGVPVAGSSIDYDPYDTAPCRSSAGCYMTDSFYMGPEFTWTGSCNTSCGNIQTSGYCTNMGQCQPITSCSSTPTPTVSGSGTRTRSSSATPSRTPTKSCTSTKSYSSTRTPTSSVTSSMTPTSTQTPTRTPTMTTTQTPTGTPSTSPSSSQTPSSSNTPTSTESVSSTGTGSITSTQSPTSSITSSLSSSPTISDSSSPSQTPTSSPTQSPTQTPSNSPSSSGTPSSSQSESITPTPSISFSPTTTISETSTISPSQTGTPSSTVTPTNTITPSSSVTSEPTQTTTETTTQTPSPTPTLTTSFSSTPTISETSTISASQTETPSSTVTPTMTMTPTVSYSSVPTLTATETPTPTSSPSQTPSISFSPTTTISETSTISASQTETPTGTVTPTGTITPTSSITSTSTQTESETPTPTTSPTQTPSSTISSSVTPSSSMSSTSSISDSATMTSTQTITPTGSITPSPSITPSSSASSTVTPTMTETPTSSLTPSPTSSPTVSKTSTMSVSSSPTQSPTSTISGSQTMTPSVTMTPSITPSTTRTPSPCPTPPECFTIDSDFPGDCTIVPDTRGSNCSIPTFHCDGSGNCTSNICQADDSCFGSPCYEYRRELYINTTRFMFSIDHCLNHVPIQHSSYILNHIVTLPGYVGPKSVLEWIKTATILIHRSSDHCVNLTSCQDFYVDQELQLEGQYILDKLETAIETDYPQLKCHPDTLGIGDVSCYPANGAWWGLVEFEDLLKVDDFVDSDFNDIVSKERICKIKDSDSLLIALWTENILIAKGSYFSNHTVQITTNGSFVHVSPYIQYVDTIHPLFLNGSQYSVTRKYNIDRTPTINGWNETGNIATLLDNSGSIIEQHPHVNLLYDHVINTSPASAMYCPNYFTHTISYPNEIVFDSTPIIQSQIYIMSYMYTHRASILSLEDGIGNSSIVYNVQDFAGITHLNMTTGLIIDEPCFKWCGERESIFKCYPSFMNYSNFLLDSTNTYCPNDNSCYHWYRLPNSSHIYENSHLIDKYGTCF